MTETFNIGVGRAACVLSELTDHQYEVLLSVPDISLLNAESMAKILNDISGNELCAVMQDYSGPFEGTAVMVYSEEDSIRLVRILLGSDFPIDKIGEVESDALCEVGNIVLNSCLAAIGELVQEEIVTKLPRLTKGSSKFLGGQADKKVLYLRMKFSIKEMDLAGHISFLIEVDKIEALVRCLDEAMKRMAA